MLQALSLAILLVLTTASPVMSQFQRNKAEAERDVERVFREMEDFTKLVPGDPKLSVEITYLVGSWRFYIRWAAREFNVVLTTAREKIRKSLENAAFERRAEHALKEFKDYTDCKPTRFVSKDMFGWNIYSEAMHSQTKLAVRLVEALETPNADRISRDYESQRVEWFNKFVARDYMSVCGKEFK